MGNNHSCDEIDRFIKHEREIGEMSLAIKVLTEQQGSFIKSLDTFNKTINELTIAITQQQENMPNVTQIGKEIGLLNHSIFKLENTINDFKDELKIRDVKIAKLESSTDHLKWLNDGSKTVSGKIGIVIMAIFFILTISSNGMLGKLLKVFGVAM